VLLPRFLPIIIIKTIFFLFLMGLNDSFAQIRG
jgi:hypothetical protein